MGNLKIGMYEQDITPIGPVNLRGQFYLRISEYVESPLKACIFACEADDEQLIIVSCDSTNISMSLTQSIRKSVSQKCKDIDTSKIVISATHAHTTPDYYEKEGDRPSMLYLLEQYLPNGCSLANNQNIPEHITMHECFCMLSEAISNGIVNAWNMRKPAYIAAEFGRAVVGHSRRVVYSDGSAKMYGDTNRSGFVSLESGNDSGIELLYAFDENKKPLGALVNVACPAQVLEHCFFVSSDYWGKVRKNVKSNLGENFVTVGICSAAGCQSPRDMIRFVEPDTKDPNLHRVIKQYQRKTDPDMYGIDGTIELGERIANVVLNKISRATDNLKDTVVFKHEILNLNLPIRKVSEQDCIAAKEKIENYFMKNKKNEYTPEDLAFLHESAGIIDRFHLQEKNEFYEAEIHIARLGENAYASFPFELFLDYGNQIRARSAAKQTFLAELAVDGVGYLPTERAEHGGHYSAYITSGMVGHTGGEILVNEIVNTIKKLFL